MLSDEMLCDFTISFVVQVFGADRRRLDARSNRLSEANRNVS